ncbi:OsmC family protein [Limibacter armeniacum]|uniref:OsmC family protein n=1 Tax=Limibacter armeniacum TaxID=466084 RepID=UPI002FE66A7C
MRIELNRLNEGIYFEGVSEEGNTVRMDGKAGSELGEGKAMSPMQLVLTAVAGCSVIDIVGILKKQRQDLRDVKIVVDGDRADAVPAPFTKVHIHFDFYGNLDETKVARAVELGVDKYCSVGEMVNKTADITHSFKIHP